jgi:3-oxoacyl-[acyl-carrier protein] reductase
MRIAPGRFVSSETVPRGPTISLQKWGRGRVSGGLSAPAQATATITAMDVAGTRVLVTGSSRGIGRATAIAFAERGARVAVHYRGDEAAARKTLSVLAGTGHVAVQGEVADPAEAERIVEESVGALGGIDVLVNNAGIYEEHALPDVSYPEWQARWRRIVEVNLLGPAWLTWCAVRHMLGQGGRIVNVSSRGAFRGEPRSPAYGASKAGLNAMGQSLARALAPHRIFVGTVAPGWVETDMALDHLAGPSGAEILAGQPTGRVATAEDVAWAVLFLASPAAEHCTGTIIDVNGASYLRS